MDTFSVDVFGALWSRQTRGAFYQTALPLPWPPAHHLPSTLIPIYISSPEPETHGLFKPGILSASETSSA